MTDTNDSNTNDPQSGGTPVPPADQGGTDPQAGAAAAGQSDDGVQPQTAQPVTPPLADPTTGGTIPPTGQSDDGVQPQTVQPITPPPAQPVPPAGQAPVPPVPPVSPVAPVSEAPAAGQPPAATPAAGQPPAGQKGSNLGGIMEEDVDISNLVANAGSNQEQSQYLTGLKIAAHPNTTFDEQNFLQLLAGSISLTLDEKKRIIDAIPQLSQFQVDELIKIFDEERGKFAELEKKHADQIQELEQAHAGSAEDLHLQQEEDEKRQKEEDEAEALKKSLGL